MKKFSILCGLAFSFLGNAQIPTNGLLDYWQLNDNVSNSVSQGQSLTYQSIFVCNQEDLTTPIYASIYSPLFFEAGPSESSQKGYHVSMKSFNQNYLCYSLMNPNGYNQPFTGNYQNYLYTPSDYNFGSNSRSVAMWIKRYAASNSQHADYAFFTGGTSGNQGFTMQLNSGSAYVGTYGQSVTQGTIPIDELWHHYVAIYHNNMCYIYFDGQLLASGNAGSDVNTTAGPMYFGVESGNLAYDNIMVYDRQLTAAEVQAIYNTQLNGESSASLSNAELNDLGLFPNPASTEFTVTNLEVGGRLTIMDISGKVVFASTVDSDLFIVKSSDFVDGMYCVQFESNGRVSQKKLVIKK